MIRSAKKPARAACGCIAIRWRLDSLQQRPAAMRAQYALHQRRWPLLALVLLRLLAGRLEAAVVAQLRVQLERQPGEVQAPALPLQLLLPLPLVLLPLLERELQRKQGKRWRWRWRVLCRLMQRRAQSSRTPI